MTDILTTSSSVWLARYTVLMWIGIVLNMFFVIPLFFFPEWTLAFFGIPPLAQTIWPRASAMLLLIISVFYVPVSLDFERYRVYAWLAVFPSRTFGATFFLIAVLVFGQPPGFLVMTLLDGSVGLATLFCLVRIEQREARESLLGERP